MADSPDSKGQYPPQNALQNALEEAWKSWIKSPDDDNDTPKIIYDHLRWPGDPDRLTLFYTDCQGWIETYSDKNIKFLMKEKHILVVCERCSRVYRQDMSEVDLNGPLPALPMFQLSFAYCPANTSGSCYKDRRLEWALRREIINIGYDDAALRTMDTLRNIDLTRLIRSLWGFGPWHELPFQVQLGSAYKALRVPWIRSFSAYEQDHPINLGPDQPKPAASLIPNVPAAAKSQARFWDKPKVMEHGNKQVDLPAVWAHMTYGQLHMWGDVKYDLDLFEDGYIKESELISVYGMRWEALQYLSTHGWDHEIDYLNAYAGLRHRVDGDHYFLMRTACQRASTAMDRLLDVYATGYVIKPGCEKLYALSGMRFQELLSSMCADMTVLRVKARAVEKPLDASWWKSRTEILWGKRVELAYLTTREMLSGEIQ